MSNVTAIDERPICHFFAPGWAPRLMRMVTVVRRRSRGRRPPDKLGSGDDGYVHGHGRDTYRRFDLGICKLRNSGDRRRPRGGGSELVSDHQLIESEEACLAQRNRVGESGLFCVGTKGCRAHDRSGTH